VLKQEELAFFKALSNTELPSVFLQEVRKAMAATKKKTLAASKANAVRPTSTIQDPGARLRPTANFRSIRGKKNSPTQTASLSQPATTSAPRHLFDNEP
jgi:hypothetical protein